MTKLSDQSRAVLRKCKNGKHDMEDPTDPDYSQRVFAANCATDRENSRLLPVIQSLLELVDMQSKALIDIVHDMGFPEVIAAETLAEADKRLKGLSEP